MSEEQLKVDVIAEQLKIHCPGSAFHADSKVHAELMANRFMDFTAHLLSQLATIERNTAEKCKQIAADREDEMSADYPSPGIDNRISRHFNLGGKP